MLEKPRFADRASSFGEHSISVIAIGIFVGLLIFGDHHDPKITGIPVGFASLSGQNNSFNGFSTANLALAFEKNEGQVPESVRFLARGPGYCLLVEDEQVIWMGGATSAVAMRWIGGNPPHSIGALDETPSRTNYYIGGKVTDWLSGVRQYRTVKYESIYSGIDLLLYGNPAQLEFDFVVAPGADPEDIILEFDGVIGLIADAFGGYRLLSEGKPYHLQAPVLYQQIDGRRAEVEGVYRRLGGRRLGFRIGEYDREIPLVIDPVVSAQGTYIGGPAGDGVTSIARDEEGNLYLAGYTWGRGFLPDPIREFNGGERVDGQLPTGSVRYLTGGMFATWEDATNLGSDAYVMKLNPAASQVVWSTYLGGNVHPDYSTKGGDAALDLDVDTDGNVFVTGGTSSHFFPGSGDAFLPARASGFLTKLDAGGALEWSRYIGGGQTDWSSFDATNLGFGVAADPAGNAYVTGITGASDFPTTRNAFQHVNGEYDNVYVDDGIVAAWNCGETFDGQSQCDGTDAFVVKFGPDGDVAYATLLGSVDYSDRTTSDFEYGAEIAVDSRGRAYVVGGTTGHSQWDPERNGDFPTTEGAYQRRTDNPNNNPVAFVSILSSDGTSLEASTLLGGGTGSGEGVDLVLDDENNVYLTGYTTSETYPIAGPFDTEIRPGICVAGSEWRDPERCGDAIISKLDPSLSTLLFSMYLGGSGPEAPDESRVRYGEDSGTAIDLDSQGNILVAGFTFSEDFPTLDAKQDSLRGPRDGFVAKIDANTSEIIYSTYVGNSGYDYVWDALGSLQTDGIPSKDDPTASFDWIVGAMFPADDPFFELLPEPIQASPGAYQDGFLVGISSVTPMAMIPEGVGYDSFNYKPDEGELVSLFTGLKVSGTGLGETHRVVFKDNGEEDVWLDTELVEATDTEVTYDLKVVHGSRFGEREMVLLKDDGTELVNVTKRAGKGFLVTKVAVSFNQAVDDRSLKEEAYHRIQISNKHGVVRVQFDGDDSRNGENYRGELHVIGQSGVTPSIQDYPVMAGYTVQEILDGRDYLTMPYPGTDGLTEGDHTLYCDMYSDAWHIRTPDLARTFFESEPLDIVTWRIGVPRNNGTIRNPPYTRLQQNAAIRTFLEGVFPLSKDELSVNERPGRDMSPLVLAHLSQASGRLSDAGELALGAWILQEKEAIDRIRRRRGDTPPHVFMALLPEDVLTPGSVGMAWPRACVIAISDEFSQLGVTVVHEIGHVLGTCMRGSDALRELNLGDEYAGGQFSCSTNPPAATVPGVKYERNPATGKWEEKPASCPDSPLVENVHANRTGSFASESAFDPVAQVPMFYTNTTPGRRSYNYMAGVLDPGEIGWVSSLAYNATLPAFAPLIQLVSDAVDKNLAKVLEVTGWLYDDNTGTINGAIRVEGYEPDGAEAGTYVAELQDNAGSVLAQAMFDAPFYVLSNPPRLTNNAFFRIRLPDIHGARWVVVRIGSTEIARLHLSENAPTIRIRSPQSGADATGLIDMTWTGEDADGDSLNYTVIVYPDTEAEPFTAAVGLSGSDFRLDLSDYELGPAPEIGVLASDGYNETEARVQLNISSVPRINGITPSSLKQGATGVALTISGSGFVDGATVSVSGGGVIVSGVSLGSSGELTATVNVASDAALGYRDLSVVNPGGESAQILSALQVVSSGKMSVLLNWDPPDSTLVNGPPRNLTTQLQGSTRLPLAIPPVRSSAAEKHFATL